MTEPLYRIIHVPKRNGSYRTIYVPSVRRRRRLRRLLPRLTEIALDVLPAGVVHGFMPGRSPVTNAWWHRGYRWSVCFDLADWFDTVDAGHVAELLGDEELLRWVLVDGAPRQGLPTSPMVANIAAAHMDHALLDRFAGGVTYTRYADDLSLSTDSPARVEELLRVVPEIVARHRFRLNGAKTHVQSATAGRRFITGVGVDDDLHPPRRMKRRLRAAEHQRNRPQAAGLGEWCGMKLPKAFTEAASVAEKRQGVQPYETSLEF